MQTTDDTNISAEQESHVDSTDNDNGKTQEQIDKESRQDLVKAEVSAPISESQVQPGREVVDGNGLRETPDTEPTRPDVIVDLNVVTQSKIDALDAQQEHGKRVQDEQNAKLDQNTKPGTAEK